MEAPPETTGQHATLLMMANDVWAGIAWSLSVVDVGQLAPCCKLTAQEASDTELWLHLFMRSCWPPSSALLAFAEGAAGCSSGIDWRARLRTRATAPPTIVVDIGMGYTKFTVVHGIDGRPEGDLAPRLVQLCSSPTHPPDCSRGGQLRFVHAQLDSALAAAASYEPHPLRKAALALGMAPSVGGVALVQALQARPELNGRSVRLKGFQAASGRWEAELIGDDGGLCRRRTSSGDSASGSAAESLNLSSAADSGREVRGLLLRSENLRPLRRARDLPLLIGEPFWETASRGDRNLSGSNVAEMVRAELGGRPGPVRIVPQAQMALWAHGVDHGIVVNIGQRHTIALPVINGEVAVAAAMSSDLGSSSLTMAMTSLLQQRHPFIDSNLMTWCRDVKEQYCYVAPPAPFAKGGRDLRTRLAAGDDFGIQRIEVEVPGHGEGTVQLAEERVLVPELLFEDAHGRPTLPQLVAGCAEQVLIRGICDERGVQQLLQQIVLVGGAADFPAIRPRVEFEVRSLLHQGAFPRLRAALSSAEDVFVLNPPLGEAGPLTSPRFVPLIGGCVRAAGALRFDEWSIGDGATLVPAAGRALFNPALREVPGVAAWMRRRLLNFEGVSVFRTGGGGGEDDNIWEMFGDEHSDLHEEASDREEFLDVEALSEVSDDSTPSPASFASPSCPEAGGADIAGGAGEAAAPASIWVARGRGGRGATGGTSKAKGKGKGRRKGKRTGQRAADGHDPGRGKGQGGSTGSARGRVWRPVQA